MDKQTDIAIIGAGPGGYVAALRGAQLKKRIVLVEEDKAGGTCMNYGCIPTKYLLHQTKVFKEWKECNKFEGPLQQVTFNWKKVQEEKGKVVERLVRGVEFLLKKNGVEFVRGRASLKDEKHILVQTQEGESLITAEKVILSTGSRSADFPFLRPNGKEVITSQEALELEAIPRTLLIVGAGAIGVEMGTIYSRMGTQVTILEMMPTILPGCDKEMAVRLEKILRSQGMKILTQMKIEHAVMSPENIRIKGTDMKNQSVFEIEAEKVLMAAGRKPNSEVFQSGPIKISSGKTGSIEVNSRMETNIPGIYAVGDLIGGKLLAHKASHEGLVAVENAAGGKRVVEDRALPMAVFTEPEFATVGITEGEARDREGQIQVGTFSFQANGRALTIESTEGLVKIIANTKDEIIGAHILGPLASELIPELTLAVHKRLKLRDISSSIHIHPTLSEAVMEATLKAKGEALHCLNE
ncbi:MAG: dihydrolipoyl dehydrogenase [Candidatus Aminicenantales bacterium]